MGQFTRAGRRVVPLPPFVAELREHRRVYGERRRERCSRTRLAGRCGDPVPQTGMAWRPALVRAGLLGKVVEEGARLFRGTWHDDTGRERSDTFATEVAAVKEVARRASGGLRFHDLRHSYATWLVSDGVPVNDVQRIMGHEQATTTLNLYTHDSGSARSRVRGLFADFPLTQLGESTDPGHDSRSENGL